MMNSLPKLIAILTIVAISTLMGTPASALTIANPCGYCTTPTVSQGNGAVQHPEVVLIFWQDSTNLQWTSGTNSPTMSQWIGYAKQVIDSAYTAGLSQYAGSGGYIARPRFSGFAPIFTGTAPVSGGTVTGNHSAFDAWNITNYEIAQGLVPPPIQYTYGGHQVTDDVIYVVIAPSGDPSGCSPNGQCGCIGEGCNTPQLDEQGRAYESIFLTQPSGVTTPSLDFGHELVEAITYWQGGVGLTNCGTLPAAPNNQIADYCDCSAGHGTLDYTQAMASYYSAADGACVIPEAWGDLLWTNSQGGSWVDSGYNLSQLSGGAGGVAGLDQWDQVNFFNTASGWTNFIQEPFEPSQVTAAGSYIGLLSLDTAQQGAYGYVGSYDPTWYTIPPLPLVQCSAGTWCPYPTPVTQLTMSSADESTIFALDPTGEVWGLWGGVWNELYARCDEIVAHGGYLLCLNMATRQGVWYFPPSEVQTSEHTWYKVASLNYPAVHIVTSSDNANAGMWGVVQAGEATLMGSYNSVWAGGDFASFSLDPTGWQGGFVNEERLSGNIDFADWYQPSTDDWYEYENTSQIGRLVSGGNIYATSCSGMSATCAVY